MTGKYFYLIYFSLVIFKLVGIKDIRSSQIAVKSLLEGCLAKTSFQN